MPRGDETMLLCRVTVHMAGGARVGDLVRVDTTDPWILAKIDPVRGPLVPVDLWDPADAVIEDDHGDGRQAADPAGSSPSTLDDTSPIGEG